MSGFIEVMSTEGFEPGTMREVEVDGHKLLVARVGDEFLVTDGRCPHLGGHLGKGALEGSVVTCPLHHSQFDLRDGSCLRWTDWKGAVLSIAELARHPRPLRAYESKVEDGKVFIGAEKAPGSVPE
jgi:3-phenylpropionate/trans-cinnamate dioxygenase ferredoxin component